MGALETLYALVYGRNKGGGESDLLGAPSRLQLYALQKLLQGGNAYGDIVDYTNEEDVKRAVCRWRDIPI